MEVISEKKELSIGRQDQMIDKNTLLEAKEFVINTKEEIESNESDK